MPTPRPPLLTSRDLIIIDKSFIAINFNILFITLNFPGRSNEKLKKKDTKQNKIRTDYEKMVSKLLMNNRKTWNKLNISPEVKINNILHLNRKVNYSKCIYLDTCVNKIIEHTLLRNSILSDLSKYFFTEDLLVFIRYFI